MEVLLTPPCSRLPKQKSSAHLPKPLKRPSWSSHLAGAHERHAFGPQLWTSCPAGTRKAEGSAALPSGVQQRCPRAPTPEPDKGRRPGWFSGPAPSGSCLTFVLFLFLSFGRGRHVPAPSGRDVGSYSGGPDPRTGLFRYLPSRSTF